MRSCSTSDIFSFCVLSSALNLSISAEAASNSSWWTLETFNLFTKLLFSSSNCSFSASNAAIRVSSSCTFSATARFCRSALNWALCIVLRCSSNSLIFTRASSISFVKLRCSVFHFRETDSRARSFTALINSLNGLSNRSKRYFFSASLSNAANI